MTKATISVYELCELYMQAVELALGLTPEGVDEGERSALVDKHASVVGLLLTDQLEVVAGPEPLADDEPLLYQHH